MSAPAPPSVTARKLQALRAASVSALGEIGDEHRFLHGRVELFVRILLAFLVLSTLGGIPKVLFVAPAVPNYRGAIWVTNAITAGYTLALAIVWWRVRRARDSAWALRAAEAAGTVVLGMVVASFAPIVPPSFPYLLLMLMTLVGLVLRAAIVPSTGRRTFAVGVLSTIWLALVVGWLGPRGPNPDVFERFQVIGILVWSVLFSAVTAIVSKVIYGLQVQVREALQLGNYTLTEKLGEGGMGEVYLAKHRLLKRPTAVKLLRPDKAGAAAITRFEREVQLSSALTHPGTVAVYDYGHTPDGVFYYAMEYLDGLDLDRLVELDGPQPAARVVYLIRQVAHALAHAHDKGLIHRDIKPANIVLCNLGGLADATKVVDFGLVKELSESADVALTAQTTVTGTPQYMPPEALTAPSKVDHRSDIYALGAVAYYLLTGEHVFLGATAVEVCSHHLHSAPVPPSERLGKPVPKALEEVILRCLAKGQDERFDSADALRDALDGAGGDASWGLDEAIAWWDEHGGEVADANARQRTALR